MTKKITVVGAANVDITATPVGTYRPGDSNPSHVDITFGGVGRNIAHNLHLLGHDVELLTAMADDALAHALRDDCRRVGLDIDRCPVVDGVRSNYFICVNDHHGEMQAGAADMELMTHLKPAVLAPHIDRMNTGAAVVADCNLTEEALRELARQCTVPLYVDGTSAVKSARIAALLDGATQCPLIVKLNRAEARELSGVDGDDSERMARALTARGITRVYITLGAQGGYCHDGRQGLHVTARPVDVVNATGAGDAFMAGVIHAELHGHDMAEAAHMGIMAAAMALQCHAAVNPDLHKIKTR